MYSLKELYRAGLGPSSSHTIGPFRASSQILERHPNADFFRVTLQGSIGITGVGHFTDKAILSVLGEDRTEIVWNGDYMPKQHPNGLLLEAFQNGTLLESWQVYSIGGGTLIEQGKSLNDGIHAYPHHNFTEIYNYCTEHNIQLWEYVDRYDDPDIWEYLDEIRQTMMDSIKEGLQSEESLLPLPLTYKRRAKIVYENALHSTNPTLKENGLLSAYALAVSEQNASMGKVVTAPTCGACGVLPSVLRYMQEIQQKSDLEVCRALAVAGILGITAKHNASISGAEAGCQAEIGVGCSMAAGAAAYLLDYDIHHIENSAEVAMEHCLGMTCDPLGGYVVIPCIERNAAAAMRAVQSAYFVYLSQASNIISYDEILQTMLETGHDMAEAYRETSVGGMAKLYSKKLGENTNTTFSPQKGQC